LRGARRDAGLIDQPAGFKELEHTADWELLVWAPDLPTLFVQAAQGMYALAGLSVGPGPRCWRSLDIQAHDLEALLVNFLTEVLYFEVDEGLVFDRFKLEIVKPNHAERYDLSVNLSGALAASPGKDIKAVTYHKLNIEQGSRGFEVRIVFDV
jgi:SHS2 domain-containing protein